MTIENISFSEGCKGPTYTHLGAAKIIATFSEEIERHASEEIDQIETTGHAKGNSIAQTKDFRWCAMIADGALLEHLASVYPC